MCFSQAGKLKTHQDQVSFEISIVFCRTKGILYNRATIAAIVQQAIKKPLVTSLLPERSYTWGRRCELNYDQLFSFGQVIPKWFRRQNNNGDRRWFRRFLKKPIASRNLIMRVFARCSCACGTDTSFMIFAGLTKGYSRVLAPVITNKRKPGIGSTWLSLFPILQLHPR